MGHLGIRGLIAPPHTPFHADGSLDLGPVERQARHFVESGVRGVFLCGSTGEYASLSFDERDALTRRWCEVARGTGLVVIAQVGGNRLREARELARRAEAHGTDAIAMLAPSYFKPATVAELVACCTDVAAGAPELPFYYYDIPELTGVRLPTDRFIEEARGRLPSLAGIKYTNPDLAGFQRCLALADELDILFGCDEALLAGLALGARGAVGSTYNFAAGVYHRMTRAFEAGEWESARAEQLRSVRLVDTLNAYGYLGAAKSVMSFLDVDCGPVRAPVVDLTNDQRDALRRELEAFGFFEWRSDASS